MKPGLVQEKYKSVKKDMNGNPSPQKILRSDLVHRENLEGTGGEGGGRGDWDGEHM